VNGSCEVPHAAPREESPCDGASVTPQPAGSEAFRPGTRLSVAVRSEVSADAYETVLIPKQCAETRRLSDGVWLNQTGMFDVVLKYNVSTADGRAVRKQCPLLSTLEVKCGAQEQVVDGRCQPRELCRASDGFWEDDATTSGGTKCLKRPKMAAKVTSDMLAVVLKKSSSMPNLRSAVEIRLVSGDVDATSIVQWFASSSSEWVVLEQLSGTISSVNPVVTINLVVVGSGRNDTAVSGPLHIGYA
jgi:hypothetical protein